jgi:hypothetical protein
MDRPMIRFALAGADGEYLFSEPLDARAGDARERA